MQGRELNSSAWSNDNRLKPVVDGHDESTTKTRIMRIDDTNADQCGYCCLDYIPTQ